MKRIITSAIVAVAASAVLAPTVGAEGGWSCPPGTYLSWTEHPPSPYIDGDTYTAPNFPFTVIALKAGTEHFVFGDGTTELNGQEFTTPNGKDISHVDQCKTQPGGTTSTSTSTTSTTSTTSSTTTSSTSVPPSTSTTTTSSAPTTTVVVTTSSSSPEPTTSLPSSTTTTTPSSTSSTDPTSSTSTVPNPTTSWPPPESSTPTSTLPPTGGRTQTGVLVASAALLAGLGATWVSRRRLA